MSHPDMCCGIRRNVLRHNFLHKSLHRDMYCAICRNVLRRNFLHKSLASTSSHFGNYNRHHNSRCFLWAKINSILIIWIWPVHMDASVNTHAWPAPVVKACSKNAKHQPSENTICSIASSPHSIFQGKMIWVHSLICLNLFACPPLQTSMLCIQSHLPDPLELASSRGMTTSSPIWSTAGSYSLKIALLTTSST